MARLSRRVSAREAALKAKLRCQALSGSVRQPARAGAGAPRGIVTLRTIEGAVVGVESSAAVGSDGSVPVLASTSVHSLAESYLPSLVW